MLLTCINVLVIAKYHVQTYALVLMGSLSQFTATFSCPLACVLLAVGPLSRVSSVIKPSDCVGVVVAVKTADLGSAGRTLRSYGSGGLGILSGRVLFPPAAQLLSHPSVLFGGPRREGVAVRGRRGVRPQACAGTLF